MSRKTPLTDALHNLLAEVDAETGKTNWQKILDVLREKAASGDAKARKLLKRAESISARDPELTGGTTEH